MSFLDDDDIDPAPGGPGSRSSGAERQRQLVVRRFVALGIGVLIIIMLLLAVRGCLNARKERGFENYLSDLDSIVTTSNQLSGGFFERLLAPPEGLNEITLEAEIASDRGTADGLVDRIEGLDTPDELAQAQQELVQSFELRRDGLTGIAEAIPAALGDDGSKAIDRIIDDMEVFLASDVLYARARGEIIDVLAEQEIEGSVSQSVFLPEPVERWLDDSEFVLTLTNFAEQSGNAPAGTHGLELLSVSIDKSPLLLDLDNPVSLGGGEAPKITAEVQNGGDRPERGVTIEYSLSGSASPIVGSQEIGKLDAAGLQEVTFPPLEQTPETGTPLTLTVEVEPVLGEDLVENNSLTYTVTFE